MPRYVKDEINFHKFLNGMRQFHEVTLEQLCEGLCSVSMMKRIECGERLPEKQMRDRIMARMGVTAEGYEDYLPVEEYEQWVLRQKLLRSIENKQIREAEEYLETYRIYENQNAVEAQYCAAMELMILQADNAPIEKQQAVIEHAVRCTMSQIEDGLSEKLLSEQELNLLIEYVHLCGHGGTQPSEFERKYKQYKEILSYLENSRLDIFSRAKVYPKAAYYLSELILQQSKTEKNLELGIKVCNEAVELLRDSRKLYYFIELTEVLEKLAKEYEVYLRKENKREESEMLQAGLGEKKEWSSVIKKLYAEYHVSCYMEHFCHLYWEMESYCIGDVIRIRRQMLGLTKEQLCEGICSVKTLTRIEHKKAKTQMQTVRELFERLGLCAEYIRSRVISTDYEVMQFAEKFVWYENNRRIKEWLWAYKELEQKLCMEIPQNKQFLMHSSCLIELEQGKISDEEYVERLKELVEYTIPLECIMKPGKRFLSDEEYTLIRSIGLQMGSVENPYMEVIKEICEQSKYEYGLRMGIWTYEFLMMAVISYLGNIGKYDESDDLSNKIIKKSLISRRQGNLAEALYNNIWNFQQRIEKGSPIEQVEELQKCLCISSFNKKTNFMDFFAKLLEEHS